MSCPDWQEMAQVLIQPEQVLLAMQQNMSSLFEQANITKELLACARKEIYSEMKAFLGA